MNVKVEKQENNLVQVEIEIDAELAGQEYSKACRRINERMTIPGFRKGKAPRSVVEKFAGVEKIQRETLDRILPKVLADTISEHQFELATEPYVESFKFELGKPLSVKAKLELKPEVSLNNYKGQTVEVPEFKTPETAVDDQLKLLVERFTTSETVIDRPVGENDIVFIDFAGAVNGESIKNGSAKNYRLDIANSNFIEGFAPQLVGKNIGEEFIINVTFPKDYQDPALSEKPAEFNIKINEIKGKIVPEINDELAQKVGPFKTLEELKADLSAHLEKTQKAENNSRAEKTVLAKVVENAQVDIPDSMINKEAKILLEEVQERMKKQGVSWEQILDSQGQEKIWNNLREEASKRIKNSLVLGAIAKAENIQLKEEDFVSKSREMSSLYGTDEKTFFKYIAQNPELLQSMTQQILGQDVVKFLLENNVVKYIEDGKEPV